MEQPLPLDVLDRLTRDFGDRADAVAAMRALDAMPEVEKTSLFGTSVHAVLRDEGVQPQAVADRLGAEGNDVRSVVPVPPSLEDVFLDVVEKAGRA